MAMTNKKHKELRREYCAAACVAVDEMCADADLRGVSHKDVATSIAVALTAIDATLAGEVIARCQNALRLLPVTKIVAAPPGTTVN